MSKNDDLLDLFFNLTVTIRENMIQCARADITDISKACADMPESETKDSASDIIDAFYQLISIAKYQTNFTAILSIIERYRKLKEKKDRIIIDLQTQNKV